MRTWLRKWWPVWKALLAIAILVAIGRQFARDLSRPELWHRTFHPGWLALSGVLYLVGLGFSSLYWYRLLHTLGQRTPFLAAVRAHYVGQMGKYLPGKAWALILRSNLVRGPETRVGAAVMTSFYEVFITMATGALLAALYFGVQGLRLSSGADWHVFRRARDIFAGGNADVAPVDPRALALLALGLWTAIAIPSIPAVFHRLVQRMALPFRDSDTGPVPTPGMSAALQGMLMTPACWLLMGASLWTTLRAADLAPVFDLASWLQYAAFLTLAYVAGFVVIFLPSGLGARETLLLLVLVPDLGERLGLSADEARPLAVMAVVALRVLWTASEVVVVAVVYWLPPVFLRMRRGAVDASG